MVLAELLVFTMCSIDFCRLYIFFKIFFFFWCEPFFRVFIEFVTILFLFYVLDFGFWIFDAKAHGILAPQPGIKPTLLALEVEVLTTGL